MTNRNEPETNRSAPETIPQSGGTNRRRGGQPGNRNAAGAAVAPWRRLAAGLPVRPEDRWAVAEAARYRDELLADRPDPTAAEARLIELAALSRACVLLVMAAAAEGGGLLAGSGTVTVTANGRTASRKKPDLVAALATFTRAEAGALKVLGLERRAKPVANDWLRKLREEGRQTRDVALGGAYAGVVGVEAAPAAPDAPGGRMEGEA